jgi:hypothetical protein
MDEVSNNLEKWLEELSQFEIPGWDKLPEIDLYMDQVVTYFAGQLQISGQDKDSILTPSMVNNYVKSGVIDNPKQKRYNKEHLFYIMAVRTLKNVLSISAIRELFGSSKKFNSANGIHEIFKATYEQLLKKAIQNVNSQIKAINLDNETDRLNYIAFNLAIEAAIKKIIAEKIIEIISNSENKNKEPKEKPEKKTKTKDKAPSSTEFENVLNDVTESH